MEQDGHFEEIFIWMRKTYFENNPDPFAELREEIEEELGELDEDKKERVKKINENFENPLGEMFEGLI